MRDIAAFYKMKIPTLKTVKVKSDGCTYQYKGLRNFRSIGLFHLAEQSATTRQAAFDADHETLLAAEELNNQKLSSAASITTATPMHTTGNSSFKMLASPSWQSLRTQQLREEVEQSRREMHKEITKLGLIMEHDFPASHHYCGPHDNAGKVPRDGMRRDEAFENERIYNYDKCFKW